VVCYKCPICGRSFPSKKKLREHLESKHAEERDNVNPPTPPPSGKLENIAEVLKQILLVSTERGFDEIFVVYIRKSTR